MAATEVRVLAALVWAAARGGRVEETTGVDDGVSVGARSGPAEARDAGAAGAPSEPRQLGAGASFAERDLPEPNPRRPDPARTNLKHVHRGAVAGKAAPWDGHLTHAPSLALRATVEAGCTLDTATSAPTFRSCPSARSCVKGSEATATVESGGPHHAAPD